MSQHVAFRRQPVPQQYAQNLKTSTIPAPSRGLERSENEAFMQPGATIVQNNWVSTMRGVKLRGGFVRWCDLHAYDGPGNPLLLPGWKNSTFYSAETVVRDLDDDTIWKAVSSHTTPAGPMTFLQYREEHPEHWVTAPTPVGTPLPDDDPARKPIISAFEYVSGDSEKMFAGQVNKLFDVSSGGPILVKSGQTSGNYAAAQMSNAGKDWLIAVNDAGDFPLRFNGTSWVTLDPAAGAPSDGAATITYDPAKITPGVTDGKNLTYVWKYRNRLFFIELHTMNAWYLGIDSVGGVLKLIPLSGSASRGGHLVCGFSWSLDAGDGLSEKCCFVTSEGEALIFDGTDPGNAASWRQNGRYYISPPMGMNAHTRIGGDVIVATVEGIVPMSQAIAKSRGQLELAALTRPIKPLWRAEVKAKRDKPWSIERWDEYGGMFVAIPGGEPGERACLVANNATTAWGRFTWDATCFVRMRADMFFGNHQGVIMQAERSGYDDGKPYVATLVGGWELFRSGSAMTVWHQARAVFTAGNREPFVPQLDATTDYVVTIPPPPPPGSNPGVQDVWDQGEWDDALWDQPTIGNPSQRNTMWMSIGKTGFSHAPVVQVTVAQQVRPDVELIAIATTFEPAGVIV